VDLGGTSLLLGVLSSGEALGSTFHTLRFKNPTQSTLETPQVKEMRELMLHSYINAVSHKKGVFAMYLMFLMPA